MYVTWLGYFAFWILDREYMGFSFRAVIFIGPLFYIQGIVEEKARKKKEEREKEKETNQDSP